MAIKMTNEIKADMKERQYKILEKYFEKNLDKFLEQRLDEEDKKHINLISKMHQAYLELPAEIEKFKNLAILDSKFEESKKLGIKVPKIMRLNSETRTLEEIAQEYRTAYELDPNRPFIKEFVNMYEDLIEKYK